MPIDVILDHGPKMFGRDGEPVVFELGFRELVVGDLGEIAVAKPFLHVIERHG
jgi:hypothetical protein